MALAERRVCRRLPVMRPGCGGDGCVGSGIKEFLSDPGESSETGCVQRRHAVPAPAVDVRPLSSRRRTMTRTPSSLSLSCGMPGVVATADPSGAICRKPSQEMALGSAPASSNSSAASCWPQYAAPCSAVAPRSSEATANSGLAGRAPRSCCRYPSSAARKPSTTRQGPSARPEPHLAHRNAPGEWRQRRTRCAQTTRPDRPRPSSARRPGGLAAPPAQAGPLVAYP